MAAEEMALVRMSTTCKGLPLLLLLELAWACDPGQDTCQASLPTIAESLGLSTRTVMRWVQSLEAGKYLQVAHRKAWGGYNTYQLRDVTDSHISSRQDVTDSHISSRQDVTDSHILQVQEQARGDKLSQLSLSLNNNSDLDRLTTDEDKERESVSVNIQPGQARSDNLSHLIQARSDNLSHLSPAPSKMAITESMRAWAHRYAPSLEDLEACTEQWLDAMRAKGYQRADWEAEWRTGMRQAVAHLQKRLQGASGGPGGPVNAGVAQRAQNILDVAELAAQASQFTKQREAERSQRRQLK